MKFGLVNLKNIFLDYFKEPRRLGRNRSDMDDSPARPRSDSEEEVRNKPRKRSASASSQKRKKDRTLENKQKAGTSGRRKPSKTPNNERLLNDFLI